MGGMDRPPLPIRTRGIYAEETTARHETVKNDRIEHPDSRNEMRELVFAVVLLALLLLI